MTIKVRLIYSLIFFVCMIFVVGLVLVGSNVIQGKYSDRIIKAITTNSIIKVIDREFNDMQKTLSRYFLLENSSDLASYKNSHELILSQFERWEEMDIAGLKPCISDYNEFTALAGRMIKMQKSGNKSEIISMMESRFVPETEHMQKKFAENLNESNLMIQDMYNKNRLIDKYATVFSLSFVVLAIITGTIIGVKIYKSIMRPLKILRESTEKFGRGELNRPIEISSSNEFSELAHSFNKMAKDLKSLEAQLIQVDRLSSVGQLAGGIAHELNNPLSGVLGQSQIILEKISPEDPNYERVKKIERAAKRCKESVNKLLRFSRQQKYEYNTVNINSMIDDVLSLADMDLKSHNVEVKKSYTQVLKPVFVSPQHIQQVILNIVNNSIQAMADGGTLSISTKMREIPGSSSIEIKFTDTGEGIPKENLDHIFDPFFSTKPRDKSTGVGLSISLDIIKHHGGLVKAISEGRGKGATFIVSLPVK